MTASGKGPKQKPRGKPISKGERRNPTGKNGLTATRSELKKLLEEIGARPCDDDPTLSNDEAFWLCVLDFARGGQAPYATVWANYRHGKPTERVEVTGEDGQPLYPTLPPIVLPALGSPDDDDDE